MSLRYLAGFITASYNPLKVPNAPTLGTVTPGNGQVTVAFTAPANVGGGAITSYIAIVQDTSTGVAVTGTGSGSPITVTGLTNGQTYNVKVAAVNTYGPGPYSAPSANFSYAPLLFAWGDNASGQVGDNTRTNRSSPVQIGSAYWAIVSSNTNFSVAIKTDYTMWSWGKNDLGQLGLNDTTNRSSPVQVGAVTTWLKVSAGYNHSLAVRQNGTLWAWGDNQYGQLGQNNFGLGTNKLSPVQVGALTDWVNIYAGSGSSLATKTNGTLWHWGSGYGQPYRSSPVQIGALTDWANSVLGGSLIVKSNGTLWAWGGNSSGQLGLNDRVDRSSPTQVGALTNWATAANLYDNSVATKTDGTLWAWGLNTVGAVGDNTVISRSSPVQIGTDTGWTAASTGTSFSAGIRSGSIYSWGDNSSGKLGSNQVWTTRRSSPVQIGSSSNWITLYCASGGVLATRN